MNSMKVFCQCEDKCTCNARHIVKHVKKVGKHLKGHAYIAPSSFKKRIVCPASAIREFVAEQRAAFQKDYMSEIISDGDPDKRAIIESIFKEDWEEAANDGSISHEVFERACITKVSNKTSILESLKDLGASDDLLDDESFKKYFLGEISKVVEKLKSATWYATEIKLKLQGCNTYGTVDLVFESDGVLYVYDLKTGRLEVTAENNEQLLGYTTAVLDIPGIGYGPADIEIGIIGVRFKSSFCKYTTADMKKFKYEILIPRIRAAHDINPIAVPGHHCMHCSAKLFCKEWFDNLNKKIEGNYFKAEGMVVLRNEDLIDRYLLAKQTEKYIKDGKKELCIRFEGFANVKDARVRYVSPKPSLTYKNEKEAREKIKEEIGDEVDNYTTSKLMPPKNLGDAVSKELMETLLKRTVRKPYIKIA